MVAIDGCNVQKEKKNKTNIIQHKKTVTFWYAKKKRKKIIVISFDEN